MVIHQYPSLQQILRSQSFNVNTTPQGNVTMITQTNDVESFFLPPVDQWFSKYNFVKIHQNTEREKKSRKVGRTWLTFFKNFFPHFNSLLFFFFQEWILRRKNTGQRGMEQKINTSVNCFSVLYPQQISTENVLYQTMQ